MNKIVFIFIISCTISCSDHIAKDTSADLTEVKVEIVDIPNRKIEKSAAIYDKQSSQWTYENQLFSGYLVSYYPDSTVKESMSVYNGKLESETKQWNPNGRIKLRANYHNGRLHGTKEVWSSEEGNLQISKLNYVNGRAHGEQRKWYSTGELYKIMHLNMGKEDGLQQAFRKNGDLYANYEAKNGRTFGLRKAALCFGLEDEKIQYAD